ncbi:hypothetical protein V6Z12_D05G219700 [Gossypium hirsutum]|uniref:Uncharacterized protein n=2 Tax=Gossypium TaxID=3633 RepID=A0ABM3A5F6_GOSHI|nr:uncharacterized protein LOC107905590 [Gossypium hirsutum]TYH72032.1 hypothetical protein ES332_D05G225700v1 [Gossypium tomentosum]
MWSLRSEMQDKFGFVNNISSNYIKGKQKEFVERQETTAVLGKGHVIWVLTRGKLQHNNGFRIIFSFINNIVLYVWLIYVGGQAALYVYLELDQWTVVEYGC